MNFFDECCEALSQINKALSCNLSPYCRRRNRSSPAANSNQSIIVSELQMWVVLWSGPTYSHLDRSYQRGWGGGVENSQDVLNYRQIFQCRVYICKYKYIYIRCMDMNFSGHTYIYTYIYMYILYIYIYVHSLRIPTLESAQPPGLVGLCSLFLCERVTPAGNETPPQIAICPT